VLTFDFTNISAKVLLPMLVNKTQRALNVQFKCFWTSLIGYKGFLVMQCCQLGV